MTKVHCNGCDTVIQPFHSRLRLDARIWKGDSACGDDECDVDVCDECVGKNPLLKRIAEELHAQIAPLKTNDGAEPRHGRRRQP